MLCYLRALLFKNSWYHYSYSATLGVTQGHYAKWQGRRTPLWSAAGGLLGPAFMPG